MFQITQTKKKFLFIFFMSLTCNKDKPIKKTKKKLLISYLKIGGGILAISAPICFFIHHFLFKKNTSLISLAIIQKEVIPDSLIIAPTLIHEHAIEKQQETSENTSNTIATEQDKKEINLAENTNIPEIENDIHVSEQPHITSENISNTTVTEQGEEQSKTHVLSAPNIIEQNNFNNQSQIPEEELFYNPFN